MVLNRLCQVKKLITHT